MDLQDARPWEVIVGGIETWKHRMAGEVNDFGVGPGQRFYFG